MKGPSRKQLMQIIDEQRQRINDLSRQSRPWLSIPGLTIFLDDTTDADYKAEVIQLALKHLKKGTK